MWIAAAVQCQGAGACLMRCKHAVWQSEHSTAERAPPVEGGHGEQGSGMHAAVCRHALVAPRSAHNMETCYHTIRWQYTTW